MHIEPGLVAEGKIWLSYITAAGAIGYGAKLGWDAVKERAPVSLLVRSVVATGLVFVFFEVFPHYPVGVSEVHLILGSTLFLLFGAAPAAIGLVFGLLFQSLFFEPTDLPQFGMNVTTLLVPLFGVRALATRIIRRDTPYVELEYRQALALSTAYQAGIVAWVAFWAFYGQGLTAENATSIASFGAAYLLVIVIEPLADLAVLAGAKTIRALRGSPMVELRLFGPRPS